MRWPVLWSLLLFAKVGLPKFTREGNLLHSRSILLCRLANAMSTLTWIGGFGFCQMIFVLVLLERKMMAMLRLQMVVGATFNFSLSLSTEALTVTRLFLFSLF